MKKRFVLLLPCLLMLSGCSRHLLEKSNPESAFKIQKKEAVNNTVLDVTKDYKTSKNVLPPSYYGNYPDRGTLEICGKAGNIYAPDGNEKSITCKETTTMWFLITFKEDIRNFSSTKEMPFGFTLEYTKNEIKQTFTAYMTTTRLGNYFFEPEHGKFIVGQINNRDTSIVKTFQGYKGNNSNVFNVMTVCIQMKEGFIVNSLKINYAEDAKEIENVAFNAFVSKTEYHLASYEGSVQEEDEKQSYGENPVFKLDSQYGHIISQDFFERNFVPIDDVDKELTVTFQDEDGYYPNGKTAPLGSKFTLRMRAKDSSDNESVCTFILTIVDTEAPTIFRKESSESSIIVNYIELKDQQTFIDTYFVVSDNYDKDVKKELVLKSGGPLNYLDIGTWDCLVKATDCNDQVKEFPITLLVKDIVAPVIQCTASEITVSPSTKLTQEELLSNFRATDEIDGELTLNVILDEYSENYNKVGNYTFGVKATDKNYNSTTESITIIVKDNKGPNWYANKTMFTFLEGEVPTLDAIYESLVRQEIIPNFEYKSYDILSGGNLDNTLSVGLHAFKMQFVTQEDEVYLVDIDVKIVQKDSGGLLPSTDEEEKELTFWEKIVKFFQDLWAKIVAFFTGK